MSNHSTDAEQKVAHYIYRASAVDFNKVPGSPVAYWLSSTFLELFSSAEKLSDIASPCAGLQTSDNNRFLRLWHEVSSDRLIFKCKSREASKLSGGKWFPCTKGGTFRRWYGNNDYVVNWENDGEELFEFAGELYGSPTRIIKNASRYFEAGLTWSSIAPVFSMRYSPNGFIFETKGSMCFPKKPSDMMPLLAITNSKVIERALAVFSPTLDFHEGPLGKVPVSFGKSKELSSITASQAVSLASKDWDSYETSWDFTVLSLLVPSFRQSTINATYQKLRAQWRETVLEMQRLEEENNRVFIEAYGLQNELDKKVDLREITLTCNPHYRYGGAKTEAALEELLQADTMAEFLSYAVGCMFGRYSLDKPGLVLANQGETLAEYLRQIPEPRFMPDEDNVIPLLDGEWFADDVTERFRTFLRVTFGEQHYEDNLAFIEQSLGKDVRKYFIKDFYIDHVKRYKKRPIYWLFASSKGTFSALIYLHRYRTDTVSVVLQYLRDFRKKLAARLDYLQQVGISTSASQGEKTRALKEIEALKKQLLELDDYERDTLYPLATEQLPLDLDEGVKVNYLKLGSALKKIVGLEAKED